CQNYSSTPLTF
nr:immunoglobulin light chain junction region [Macaca mulatta]